MDPDGALKAAVRPKIQYYLIFYPDRQEPIVYMPLVVSTSGHFKSRVYP
jgi:hypothetical protein